MSKKNKDLRTSPITALPGVVYDGIAGVVNSAVRMSPISFTDNRKDGEGVKKFAAPKSGFGSFAIPKVKKQSGGKRKTRRRRKSRRKKKTRRRRKKRKRKTRRRRKK
tara:strand:+ start:4423 stop:4743 length:321 start_codon:yes stop_codon:yes gene_type:complete